MLIVNVCLCLYADMLDCAVLEMRQILAQCVPCKSSVNVIFTTCVHERFFLSFNYVFFFDANSVKILKTELCKVRYDGF